MFVDNNHNGIWDTGEYRSLRQPEMVYYFPRPIPLRAKFDMEQDWNFRSIDATKQKPMAITKQKADKKKSIQDKNRKREEQKRQGK